MSKIRKINNKQTVAAAPGGPLKTLMLMPIAVTELLKDFHNNNARGYFNNIYQNFVCKTYDNRRAIIIEDFMAPHFNDFSVRDDIEKKIYCDNFAKNPILGVNLERMYYVNLNTEECKIFAKSLVPRGALAGKYHFFGTGDYTDYINESSGLRHYALLKLACCVYLESKEKLPAISIARRFTNVDAMALTGVTNEYAAMVGTYPLVREIAI